MTCSALIAWFAERGPNPTSLKTIHWRIGKVDNELRHLVQLGMLNRWFDLGTRDQKFSLKGWTSYQGEKAA